MTDTYSLIYFILFLIMIIGFAFFISAYMTKRAVSRVLAIFREHKAVGKTQGKTIEELGLIPPNFLDRIARPRDYRQSALKFLIKAEIIRLTEEGKLFIPEEKFNELMAKGVLK